MWLVITLLLIVLITVLITSKASERFTQFFYPFNTNDIELQYLSGTPIVQPRCTDSCVLYDRYRGQLIDNDCQNMCTNEWTPAGQQAYKQSLQQSIDSGIRTFAL
jgi:hypothetical protein